MTVANSYPGDDVTIQMARGVYVENDVIYAASLSSLTIKRAPLSPPPTIVGNHMGSVFTIGSGTVTIEGLTIEDGGSSTGVEGGGGIYNAYSGNLTLIGDTISANVEVSSLASGGGIDNSGTMTLNSVVVSGNTAEQGGGIYNSGTMTLNSTTVSGNTAAAGGGVGNAGRLTVDSSTVSGNTAIQGGGIQTSSTDPVTVDSSTVSGNGASDGGGVFANSPLTIHSSTVSANTASAHGGGIYTNADTTNVGATIVAANTAPTGGNCYLNVKNGNSLISLGYSLTDEATGQACGLTQPTDLIGAGPELAALADNGGLTQTMIPASDSPAVSAIPSLTTLSDGSPVCPSTDQRGVQSTSGANCDIGATQTPTLTVTAPSLTIALGQAVPVLTPTYGGFVAQQDATTIGNGATCAPIAVISGAGQYPIVCSGATNSATTNYGFVYVTGTVTVDRADTTTTITSTTPIPMVNQPVTVFVTVASLARASDTPTGQVTVSDGNVSSAPCTLDGSGDAICFITESFVDPVDLTASYGGDGNFNSSATANGISITIYGFGVSTASLPSATRGTAYGPVTLQAANSGTSADPYVTTLKWKIVTLPSGMKLSTTGVLSGTPKKKLTAGPSSVTVQLTETVTTLSGKKKVKTLTMVRANIPLTIN